MAGFTAPTAASNNGHNSSSGDRLLVTFHPGMKLSDMGNIHKQIGANVEVIIPGINVNVVTVPAGKGLNKMNAYHRHGKVRSVEFDYLAQAIDTPDDPYFYKQWGMGKVQAPEAWGVTQGSGDILIAILDTGVDYHHPDLASKVVVNVNFTSSPTADANGHSHGTHVAGIAAADTNNFIGIAGVGYSSNIMNVKVLGDDGYGYYSWIANGIVWATDNGADVINLSLGGTAYSSTLVSAVNYAWQNGVVVVAAAGNNGSSTPFYPAYYDNCIAVGATNSNDNLYAWSNYSEWVDVAAPGSTYSTLPENSYGYKSGTSMASPHVAGLAGLVFSIANDSNGNGRTNDEVRYKIESSCDDVNIAVAYGRINAYEAVQGSTPTTAEISGTVTDSDIGVPVSNAAVTNGTAVDITDASGYYCLSSLAPSNHTLTASADGYQSSTTEVVAQAGETVIVDFSLVSLNNPPVASHDSAETNEDTPVTIDVLANDQDIDGDNLQVTSLTQPSHGTAIINTNQTVTYIPDENFNGSDSFTYVNNDGRANSNVANVVIDVTSVNDKPVAYAQSVITKENIPVAITLSGSDVDGDVLIFNIVDGPANGILDGTPPHLEYNPNSGFVGSDSFTFKASDSTVNSNTATVSITVEPPILTMSIQSCDVEIISRWRGWYYNAEATVIIKDSADSPVQGATVSGEWTGATASESSGATNDSGQVVLKSNDVWKPKSGMTFTFTVTSVIHPELQWDSVEFSDSATVINGKK